MVVAAVQNTLEDTPDYFIINMTAADLIDEAQMHIQYRGNSKPILICNLTVYEYSLDNITWYHMTITGDSDINSLHVNKNWSVFNIKWNAMIDIIDKITNPEEGLYNRLMWVRFKASSSSLETYLVVYRVFFKSPIVKLNLDSSNNHIDINGSDLIEQAPGVF
jgi:hypothetical protein